MRSRYLSPGWLAGHVLVLVVALVCGWLGWWQLERALSSTGSGLNLGYALQWPLFGIFGIVGWIRFLRMESTRADEDEAPEPAAAQAEQPAEPVAEKWLPGRPKPAAQDADLDPELAEYNRYLKQKAEQWQQR
ncbi:hypothetical protein [Crossiella sp. CA198]|uniref:hypothetical protein n=1 Tax=Crossiella sp. CA198 TaxID=3455607 RepID=UPI003F8D88B8